LHLAVSQLTDQTGVHCSNSAAAKANGQLLLLMRLNAATDR